MSEDILSGVGLTVHFAPSIVEGAEGAAYHTSESSAESIFPKDVDY